MTTDPEFEQLLAAAEAYTMAGWDWSALEGRYVEAGPPWDYRAEVLALLPTAHVLLDMGTGGGEFLSSLAPLPPECWATEAYPPNLPVAAVRLEPLGVRVVAVEEDARLPLPDVHFDLVINRHESFDAHEVRRILRPGGVFLTQQVGGQDNVDTVWKGPPQAQITVISQHPATEQCATYFPIGSGFLIYAMRDGDSLRRAFCQRVVDLRLAADDLAQLGPGVAPAQPAQVPDARPAAWLVPGVLLLGLLVVLVVQGLRRRRSRG